MSPGWLLITLARAKVRLLPDRACANAPKHPMKSLFHNPGRALSLPLLGAFLLSTPAANAALLAYEPFTNTVGTAIIGSGSKLPASEKDSVWLST